MDRGVDLGRFRAGRRRSTEDVVLRVAQSMLRSKAEPGASVERVVGAVTEWRKFSSS